MKPIIDWTAAEMVRFREVFDTLAQQGVTSLAEAHRRLADAHGGSYQNLTQVLDKLEKDLGLLRCGLIDRNTLKPTVKGREVYETFGRILGCLQSGMSSLMADRGASVRVATTTTFAATVLPRAMERSGFLTRHPNVKLYISTGPREASAAAVGVHRTADFALCPDSPGPVTGRSVTLRPLRRVFLFPAVGPLAERFGHLDEGVDRFNWNSLRDVTVFHLPPDLYTPDLSLTRLLPTGPGGRVEINQQAILRACVARGLGVALSHEMPRAVEDVECVRTIYLSELQPINLCLYFHPDVDPVDPIRDMPGTARDLIVSIREYVEKGWDA